MNREKIEALLVGYWEEVIELADPEGPQAHDPAAQARAATLARCAREIGAALDPPAPTPEPQP